MGAPEQTGPKSPGRPDAGRVATAFVIKLVVVGLLLGFGEAQLHKAGWGIWLQDGVALVSAKLAGLLDSQLHIDEGNTIVGGAGHRLMVTLECTALYATGLFCAAVIAFPARWRSRLVGCLVGVVGVAILNVLRVSGLVVIARWVPSAFHFAHLVLMQWFLISCVTPLWLAWAVWATRRARVTRV